MSMPIAGMIAWAVIGIAGLLFPLKMAVTILILGVSVIFPLALPIARMRNEQLTSRANPLARLMGASVLMVNLLWALHIPLYLKAPSFVPLSVGIGLGLHWIVYSWIIDHPLGYRHAIGRTVGLVAAWFAFPSNPVTACAAVVVAAYVVTLVEMARRTPSLSSEVSVATQVPHHRIQ
ncbi:hypothetical protein HIV01_015460 [Lysobacter arenosi]|uniref:Uncharacterized protein n=2 Tax=Lysobacter arenosi TaxID=2795387 RepID=A0ABX7R8W9_9GAMM|nr:hypothetical protein [Lysobacter arenosi]QSX74557.1 hypothetical protein HIV01_015460 [Lysobacter arenosi]